LRWARFPDARTRDRTFSRRSKGPAGRRPRRAGRPPDPRQIFGANEQELHIPQAPASSSTDADILAPKRYSRAAFVLFETMLAVMIFVIAVLALGKCVNNCLNAERLMREDDLARRALENWMARIEAGEVSVTDPKSEELKGPFKGMTMRRSRQQLKWKNEKKEEIAGLYEIKLELTWRERGEDHERTLNFYVASRR
jgi:hypothetical protein